METLNKYLFAFTLTAFIFGVLGFLVGRQGNHHSCPMKNGPHEVMFMDGHIKMNKCKSSLMIKEMEGEGIDWIEGIDVQKHEGADGEEKITVKVKPKEE